jgi:hypothetical protein
MADTLSITDNRTGKTYEVPIAEGTIRATDLKKITTGGDDRTPPPARARSPLSTATRAS